ncbi:MAG: hypothetical protein EBS09_11930 [Flavobacteriia bacterium]|jgi:hypothetical protein|nr:hypothetical protein [Flavobacteriia bacterium]NBV68916.1 hypothetical protein [Flavobacteriia bacterium]
MRKLLFTLAIPITLSLTACNANNDDVEAMENTSTNVENEEDSENSTPNVVNDYCHTCGSVISGSPYEAFGRKYCDMGCYADDPMN